MNSFTEQSWAFNKKKYHDQLMEAAKTPQCFPYWGPFLTDWNLRASKFQATERYWIKFCNDPITAELGRATVEALDYFNDQEWRRDWGWDER